MLLIEDKKKKDAEEMNKITFPVWKLESYR